MSNGTNCPRCGGRGHIIGQPNAMYGGGVPMRCYNHGEFSWLAHSDDAYRKADELATASESNARAYSGNE